MTDRSAGDLRARWRTLQLWIADREDGLPGLASSATLAADGSSGPQSHQSRVRRTSATGPLGGDAARVAAPKTTCTRACSCERDA
jgi:hypothetical protein